MASAPAPTIPSLKQAFLSTQTTLLAQPLAASRAWQTANDASEQPLPARVVEDALFSLNHSIQQHCRRVYAPQANRNIAEQINHTYTSYADRKLGDVLGGGAGGAGGANDDAGNALGREVDLTDGAVIEALPEAWSSEKDVNEYPMEAKLYADAVRRLAELDERRNQLRDQVSRLERLKAVVKPLETENGAGIQENLLTRGGPVEKELERMRFLLVRVGGRVGGLPAQDASKANPEAVDVTSTSSLRQARKRRVDQFLEDGNVFAS